MAVPPEVLFHRFFQEHFPYNPPICPEDPDRRIYKGRHDLSGLRPLLQAQLHGVQEVYNESLRNEKQGVHEHFRHPPFHVDYVDSSIGNALAFRYEGYSFIGATLPLIFAISDACLLLSKSPAVAMLLGVRPPKEDYNELHAGLFYVLTAFVFGHEWTHHVHGHLSRPVAEPIFPNEILDNGCNGNLESQVQEIVADGYSVYLLLTNVIELPNIIDESTRSKLLRDGAEKATSQDQTLLSLCVAAVAAYLFVNSLPDLTQSDIYRLSHPPQAVRMRFIAREACSWCSHFRPDLNAWMSTQFMTLMSAVAEATLGKSGVQIWGAQRTFLKSEVGVKYFSALDQGLKDYKQAYTTRLARAAPA
jgi:hypothetical protein